VKIRFLGVEQVLSLHVDQIQTYGGADGVRDLGLLESACATPSASFEGAYLHGSVSEMAAAYLFHLAQNHPFVDGNKRVAAAATFMFLYSNGYELNCTEDELVELTLAVANGRRTKAEVAVMLSSSIVSISDT